MFSALSQGSLIHVLDKTDGLKYKIGEVIGVTQPNQYGGAYSPSSFINPNIPIVIKAKVDGEVRSFPEVPAGQSIMSYNGGNLFISETPQGIQNEVESVYKRDKQILANRDFYEKEIVQCENIMKEISPQFAQDKERDDKINNLDSKVASMESKLDKILNAISNKNNV